MARQGKEYPIKKDSHLGYSLLAVGYSKRGSAKKGF